ncbi:OBAP family protein [Azospirillum sp. ST 5-10]|uniref:OBAP family protein n=1 Tax=unclassified Azospirillum TaxID=2630922 RepID=UPI003F4A797A
MKRPSSTALAAALFAAAAVGVALARPRVAPSGPRARPAGGRKSGRTRALESGAHLLQGHWPLDDFDVYLVGFHPMKDDPERQCEAHHFCRQVNEDFIECALFDGNTADANLVGVEYIISERLFETLPPEERPYWHPHNAEILSGQLVAPGLPEVAEHALMRSKMNSYGKTWHLWDTGGTHGEGDPLPVGEARLMWSFSRLGEARDWLIRERDRRMGVDTEAKRRARADLTGDARPQEGVDALRGRYAGPTREIPGVLDKASARAAAAPGTPAPRR